MNAPYIKHDDPGHGWLAVPVADLKELGIEDHISPYSYLSRDRQTAFLEEDCDFSIFIEAYENKFGKVPEYRNVHTNADSFVRSLRSYDGSVDYKKHLNAHLARMRAKYAPAQVSPLA